MSNLSFTTVQSSINSILFSKEQNHAQFRAGVLTAGFPTAQGCPVNIREEFLFRQFSKMQYGTKTETTLFALPFTF